MAKKPTKKPAKHKEVEVENAAELHDRMMRRFKYDIHCPECDFSPCRCYSRAFYSKFYRCPSCHHRWEWRPIDGDI